MLRFVFSVGLSCMAASVSANVRTAEVFSDHVVLQRDKEIRVWGEATPNEKIGVSLGTANAEIQADANGHWSAALPPMKAQAGLTLTVRGTNEIAYKDVAVGEVWLVCGQMNMAVPEQLSVCDKAEVDHSNRPDIRFWIERKWHPCDPATAGGLSAVAYNFAKDLQVKLQVPVGILYRLDGGIIQTWTPPEAYGMVPELKAAYVAKAERHLAKVRQWADRSEKELEQPQPAMLRPTQDNELVTTSGTYRPLIEPLTKFALRGIVWNHGEANAADGLFYAQRLKGLIASWRKAWEDESLPWYLVQVPPLDREGLPDLWAAQVAAAKEIEHCDLVPTCDLGYPAQGAKNPLVGQRLARMVLSKTYAIGDGLSAPQFKSQAVEGNKIRVSFDHAEAGLVSRDDKPLTFFEIAGEDNKFVPATAAIDGQTVVVSSEHIPQPTQVRFAWRKDASHNLGNREGLPALPFRTGK